MRDIEIKFYKDKVEKYRGTPAQLGYGSEKSQSIRLKEIIKIFSLELNNFRIKCPERKFSMLDFGCGTGDLLEKLNKDYYIPMQILEYTGIDAIEENIEDAKNKFNNINREKSKHINEENIGFIHINADTDFPYDQYDFIVFSGAFSTTTPYERNALFKKFLSCAKIGVIGNFIRPNLLVDKFEDGCYLTEPYDIIKLIKTEHHKFSINADYMPHDFTVSAIRWEPEL